MILTNEQIQLIDVALQKAGIGYADIRFEMTDHIASVLEKSEDSFEDNLRDYIADNKKQIRKTNRKFIAIGRANTYKRLFWNMIKLQSAAIFAATFFTAIALNILLGKEYAVRTLFWIYAIATTVLSFPAAYKLIKKRTWYSVTSNFSGIILIIYYLSIYMLRWQREIDNDYIVMSYYTAVITVVLVMIITHRQIYSDFKLKYNG